MKNRELGRIIAFILFLTIVRVSGFQAQENNTMRKVTGTVIISDGDFTKAGNKKGTKATALTTTIIVGYGRAQRITEEPVHFFADCLFLFLISEKSTDIFFSSDE